MSGVSLRLDVDAWRRHLTTVADVTAGIVPVAKGNGYGFGLPRLAQEATRLRADVIAVGLPSEVALVRDDFAGDVIVMMPWRPDDHHAQQLLTDPRVITTVSRLEDLAAVAVARERTMIKPRVIIEVLTSMQRHGIRPDDLAGVTGHLDAVTFEGWTLHLPLLDQGRYGEAERLSRAALDVAAAPLWISHLPAADATTLAKQLGGAGSPPVPMRLRVGTRLWLGDPASLSTTATVLDVHPVRRGDRAGYRQRRLRRDGWLLVLAGGTAHGVGLEAPTPASSGRQRLIALAGGGLEAAGWALSPYTIAGKKRWFLEPPHMQTSLVLLPGSVSPPAVGQEVPVELRLTTGLVDQIVPASS